LEVGSNPCEDTDPALETDPRRQRYHLLSHPEPNVTGFAKPTEVVWWLE